MDFRSLYRLNLLFINAGGKVKYLLRLPSLSKTKKLLKTNEEIIATRKHDTIYICGLGPSLADVDLDRLIDKMCIRDRNIYRVMRMGYMQRLKYSWTKVRRCCLSVLLARPML